MLRKCNNCGLRTINDNLKICERCGTKFPELPENPYVYKATKTDWIVIIAILIGVPLIFIGGYFNTHPNTIAATTSDPNAFRTAVPTTPTPIPTPTAKLLPKFSRGDIVAYEPVTKDTQSLYIILDYDSKNDGYDVTFIHRNDDGSWGHWTFTSTDYFFEREKFEKNYNAPDTWIYGHIDPDKVHCEQLKDPDAAKFFPCTRN